MVHVVPMLATLAVMLLSSPVLPVLASPFALAIGAVVALGVTLVRDRRLALALAVAAIVALALVAWAISQPGYTSSVSTSGW